MIRTVLFIAAFGLALAGYALIALAIHHAERDDDNRRPDPEWATWTDDDDEKVAALLRDVG